MCLLCLRGPARASDSQLRSILATRAYSHKQTRSMEHGTAFKGKPHSLPSPDGNIPANMNASSGAGSAANLNPNVNSASTSNTSTTASTTLNSSVNLNASTGATVVPHSTTISNSYANSPAAQSTNRGKKFSWVKRLMNNNNAISAEPAPLTHTTASHQHHQHRQHNDQGLPQRHQQARPRGQKKDHKNTIETPKPKADKATDRGSTALRKPTVHEQGNSGKLFQFNNVTSIENDEIVSYVSSNASLKLQDSYDRQFYMRQDGYDANTIASVKSIFSGNPAPSIYSTGAVSINTSGTNNNSSNRSSFAPAPLSHISHMHPAAHSHGHNYNLNANANPNTHNHSTTQLHLNNGTSYNNYLDSASTFSGSVGEDNVSTRPLVSFSSDEEGGDNDNENDDVNDDSQIDYSDNVHAHRPRHFGHRVQIADGDTNTRTWRSTGAIISGNNLNSEEYLAESITTTGTDDDDGDDNDNANRTHSASNVDRYIQVNEEAKEHYKRHDDSDQSSFDVKSKYPSSTKSAAVTSMSVLTSPMLTTINSSTTTATTMTNNTTNTNVATAASVMTLASSSRHVFNI